MTIPPSGLPQPVPDISVDRRTMQQQELDQTARTAQVTWHRRPVPSSSYTDLVRRLNDRRAAVPQAMKLDLLPTVQRRRTIVAQGEVLVEVPAGAATEDSLRIVTDVLGAVNLMTGRLPLQGALDGGLFRLTLSTRDSAAGGDDRAPAEMTQQALSALTDAGFDADYNYVAAFQQGPTLASGGGHDVVVKNESGPSPTTVINDSLFLSEQQRQPVQAIKIAVIDTGITDQQRHDEWLKGILVNGNKDALDVFPSLGYLDFAAGHGTFAAGVIQGIEPQAEILVYHPLDSDGFGNLADVCAAMIDAAAKGAKIINLSLGVRTVDANPPKAFLNVIDDITAMFPNVDDRPVLVAAAGNFGDDIKTYPAACDGVTAVASLAADGTPSAWSSHGTWVDCSTVGEGVVAPYVVGTTDSAFGGTSSSFPAGGVGDPWAIWTGTSFAAPQISAAIARTMRMTGTSAAAARDSLLAQGQPIPDFGQAMMLLPGTL